MKFIILTLCLGSLLIVSHTVSSNVLKFKSDGTFKITQFTDTHFGNDQTHNKGTQDVITTVLKSEHPDIAILTGDMVSGYEWNQTQGWYASIYDQVVKPMNDLDFNWALTLGNHDHQADLTSQQVHQLDMSYERSMTKPNAASISHTTNYILPIYDPSGTKIMARIWMFDSGDNGCMGTDGWGCMLPDQIQWFREESQKIPLDDPSRSHGLAFFHIPTFEWMDLYNNFPIQGGKGEPVCCSSQNTGMWSAWKEQGTIEYAFVGHDHTNDYWGNYYGINLGYGRRTGQGNFNQFLHKLKVGSRVFELQMEPWNVNIWVRNEDGEKEVQQMRNRTWYEVWNYQLKCHY